HPPRDLADDARVRRARRIAEASAEAVVGETPHGDRVEVMSSIVPRRPGDPVSPSRADTVGVGDPASNSGLRLMSRDQVETVRQSLVLEELVAADARILRPIGFHHTVIALNVALDPDRADGDTTLGAR